MSKSLYVCILVIGGIISAVTHANPSHCEPYFESSVDASNAGSSDYISGIISRYRIWGEEVATRISHVDGKILNDHQVAARAKNLGTLGQLMRETSLRYSSALGADVINQISRAVRDFGQYESPKPRRREMP